MPRDRSPKSLIFSRFNIQVVHRDLKPENVLLSSDLTTPKIGDMGTAVEMQEGGEGLAGSGTPLFQAPELLRGEASDGRCDVWSFGCVCVCLSTRAAHPYHPYSPDGVWQLVAQEQLQPAHPAR